MGTFAVRRWEGNLEDPEDSVSAALESVWPWDIPHRAIAVARAAVRSRGPAGRRAFESKISYVYVHWHVHAYTSNSIMY